MKIKYSDKVKFNQDFEKNITSSARHAVDSVLEDECIHRNIELSIYIYGPLDDKVKGSIFCNDCQKKVVSFGGDTQNPMKILTTL